MFVRADLRTYGLLARAGFRRQATYRLALAAGIFTNSVFGMLRASILVGAVAGAGTALSGYDARAVSSYAWWGQVLLGSVALWGWGEIAQRVRTGDIAADLLRPLPVPTVYLAADLGRAALALLVRGVPMLAIGAAYSGVTFAAGPVEWVLGVVSVGLAVTLGFLGNYLVNCAAFWLLEIRGLMMAYSVVATRSLVFPDPVRIFFTFVVPAAFTAYLPTLVILGLPGGDFADPALAWWLPVAAAWVWLVALVTWRFGVRRYQGAASRCARSPWASACAPRSRPPSCTNRSWSSSTSRRSGWTCCPRPGCGSSSSNSAATTAQHCC